MNRTEDTAEDTVADTAGDTGGGGADPGPARDEAADIRPAHSPGDAPEVSRLIHETDRYGVGHITVRGPNFQRYMVGDFNQASTLAYEHGLLHGFTNIHGVTTWTP